MECDIFYTKTYSKNFNAGNAGWGSVAFKTAIIFMATHLNSTFLLGDCFFTPLKQAMLQCSPKNFREIKYQTQCQLKSPKINRSHMLTVLFPDSVVIKKNQNTIIVQENEWNPNVIVL